VRRLAEEDYPQAE
jgi:hypothetical protein